MGRFTYWVYIMTNLSHRVLYIGVTNNILLRAHEHREGKGSVFTSKYKINKLVYAEAHGDIEYALKRETQMKAWKREWKLQLIEKLNPGWEDLTNQYMLEAR